MSELTHDRLVEQIEKRDFLGRPYLEYKVRYIRNKKTEEEMENYRLGQFANQAITHDQKVRLLIDKKHLIFISSYEIARTIIATKLRSNKFCYKVLTGTNILDSFFADNSESKVELLESFFNFELLFIIFGYFEAENRYLASLLVQLLGQRYHEDKHVWLFIPRSLNDLARDWGERFFSLDYFPQISLLKLDEVIKKVGPELKGRNVNEVLVERSIKKDIKFQGKKK